MNDQPQENESRGFPVAFLFGLGAVVLVVIIVWYVANRPAQVVSIAALPFGETEKAYSQRIRFTDIQMSRAANFLGQEVTVIAGFIENMGTQTIQEMQFTLEFRDLSGQVVLREDVRLMGKKEPPLLGGRRRDFQFNFEKVPGTWNQQTPRFVVTGLVLQP